MRKRISLILIFAMILTLIPIDISNAVGIEDTLSHITSKGSITKNQVEVEYNTNYIDVIYGSSYTKDGSKDINTNMDILVNGVSDKSSYNFVLYPAEHKIRVSLKDSAKTLKHSSVYKVHIDAGLFKDSSNVASLEANYIFVTKNTTSQSGIITNADYTGGTITYTFIDDIVLKPDAINNKQNYITITSSLIDNLKDPSYVSDNISNYTVKIDSNDNKKLIVERTDNGDFKELSKYTVTLKPNTVYLNNGNAIYNEEKIISFNTDNKEYIVDSTDPSDNATRIGQHQNISIKFKEEIDINIDKTKVSLISRSGSIHTNIQDYVYAYKSTGSLVIDSLKIDMEKLYMDTAKEPLSKGEEYTVKIGAGAIILKGRTDLSGNLYKYNKDITFKFQTLKDRPSISSTYPISTLSNRFDENKLHKKSDGTYY
jgi:hypothetical protein